MADGLTRTPFGHWIVDGDYGVSRLVNEHGTFQYPDNQRDLCAVAMCIPEGGVVIDAGACIGDQTAIYSQMVGVTGHVYAFEPYPRAYDALVKNMARFNNVTTLPMALGANTGIVPFSVFATNIGASCLGRFDGCTVVDVPLTTLDVQFPYLTRLDFIHLDAEGMESQILDGTKTLIRKFQPSMMIEVTNDWLHRYGCSSEELLRQIAGYGYFTLMRMQPNAAQFDVLAMPLSRMSPIVVPEPEGLVAEGA